MTTYPTYNQQYANAAFGIFVKSAAAGDQPEPDKPSFFEMMLDSSEEPVTVPEDLSWWDRLWDTDGSDTVKNLEEQRIAQAKLEDINARNQLRAALGPAAYAQGAGAGAALGAILNSNTPAGLLTGAFMGLGGVGGANAGVNLHKNLQLAAKGVDPKLAAIIGGGIGALGSGAIANLLTHKLLQ